MKKLLFVLTLMAVASPSHAENFYPSELGVPSILSSSTSDDVSLGDLWPVSNLLQGPGVGFEVDEPHPGSANGADFAWVTNDNAGFPADYIEQVSIPNGKLPTIVFDFGADAPLDEISVWAYSSTNSNGVSEFALRFATDANGPDGFDTSNLSQFDFNPKNTFFAGDMPERQSFEFGEVVTARYVEFTVIDNFYLPPGDGSGGAVDEFYEGYIELPGGDRVGLGEVAFRIPEEIPTPDCDFNNDTMCDIIDIDLLMNEVGNGTNNLAFDLNGDTVVDDGDRDSWLASAATQNGLSAPYLLGDSNLDLRVDAGDLNELGIAWQSNNNNWSNGNFTAGSVNASDLNELGVNWQRAHPDAPMGATVPEPAGAMLLLLGLLGMAAARR
jgi:hypothetical protein